MKGIITIGLMCIIMNACAQTQSKRVEIFKKYENGVLTEYDSTVTESDQLSPEFKKRFDDLLGDNSFDFHGFSFDNFDLGSSFSSGFDASTKMEEMEQRMDEIQSKADLRFKQKMQEMENRMSQLQNRASQMQQEMKSKMDNRSNEQQKKADGNSKPTPEPKKKTPPTPNKVSSGVQYY
ncbi:MAG: hypothetical protein JKY54_08765 [Flavobacteriales bacterium]|nr:hypothetical protein [Flavobacteriales bacterium]